MRHYLLIIIIVCLLLSGCGFSGSIYSNYRAIEDLQLIQTLGIDRTGTRSTLSAAASATEESGTPTILRRSGGSILEAMDSLQDYTTRGELFFAHVQYILLGQDYAEQGVGKLLDFVERDVHMRLGTGLFVLCGGTAEELITGPGEADYDIAEVLASVKRDLELRGDSHVYTFRETAVDLSECGAALVCALKTVETEGSIFPEEDSLTAVPVGYGVLRSDRLAGFLEGRAAEAVSLLTGNLGTVPRRVPDGSGGEITLEYGGSAELKPQWNADGSPSPMEVEAKLTAVIGELDSDRERLMDDAYLDFLEDKLSRQIEEDIRGVLAQSQTMDADFLGLGRKLRLSDGKNFAALPGTWLQDMEFDVCAEAKIVRSYDLDNPVQTEGGKQQ